MPTPAHPAAPSRLPARLASILLVLVALSATAEVSLPGIAQANLEPAAKGRLLLEELNCVACHRAPEGTLTAAKQAPRLADVANRLNPGYLAKFILDPHATKPGTTCPSALRTVSRSAANQTSAERADIAEDLAQFLLSTRPSRFAPEAPDAVAAAAVPVAAPSGEGVSRVSALRPPGDSVDKALRLRLGAALVGVKRAELLTVPLPVLVAVMDLVRVASPLAEVVSVARPLVEEVPVAVADTLGEALRNDVAVMLPEAVREALPRDVAVMLPEAVREALPRGVAEVEPDALAVPVPDPVEEPVRVPLPVEEPVRVKRPLVVLDDVLEGPANRVLKNSDNNRRRRFIGFFHRCGHK